MRAGQDLYSSEPARGWIPWGALAPFLRGDPEASVVCFGYFVLGIFLLRLQPGKASIAS